MLEAKGVLIEGCRVGQLSARTEYGRDAARALCGAARFHLGGIHSRGHVRRAEPWLDRGVVCFQVEGQLTRGAPALDGERVVAGRFGHMIEPAIRPLGYDWKMGVGLVGAFAAREVFVSTMAITYNAGKTHSMSGSISLSQASNFAIRLPDASAT